MPVLPSCLGPRRRRGPAWRSATRDQPPILVSSATIRGNRVPQKKSLPTQGSHSVLKHERKRKCNSGHPVVVACKPGVKVLESEHDQTRRANAAVHIAGTSQNHPDNIHNRSREPRAKACTHQTDKVPTPFMRPRGGAWQGTKPRRKQGLFRAVRNPFGLMARESWPLCDPYPFEACNCTPKTSETVHQHYKKTHTTVKQATV